MEKAKMVTDAEAAEMSRKHHEDTGLTPSRCDRCCNPWPCEQARLLADRERTLREAREALEHRTSCECCIECLHPCQEFQELAVTVLAKLEETSHGPS